jgi:hypothetical protein
MEQSFTWADEFRRGKGTRKTRHGPAMRIGRKSEKQLSPNAIAINRLRNFLKGPDLSFADRRYYEHLMENAEQIRFMNMQVLAQVLLYMNTENNDPQNFSYEAITPYIERLLPHKELIEDTHKMKTIPAEELEIYRRRMAATFFRYMRYVLSLLNTDDTYETNPEGEEEQ